MRAPPPPRLDPAEVERAVERAYLDLSVEPSLWERAQRWLAEVLGRLLLAVDQHPVLAGVALLVAGLAVGGLLAWALRRGGLVGGGARIARAGDAEEVDWHALALDAERRGDLDAAVRAGHRALLADLADRGWVPDRGSLTAAEARGAMAGRGPAEQHVALATSAFEQVAYARRDASREDVAAIRHALEEVAR